MKTSLAVLVLAAALCAAAYSSETSAPVEPEQPVATPAPAQPEAAVPSKSEVAAEAIPVWTSPKQPAHARRSLDTASELARDLQEVVAYLEAGQSYYRAYQKGTHTVEENKAFLEFLEVYEKEQSIARKEADALRKWVSENTSLDTALQP